MSDTYDVYFDYPWIFARRWARVFRNKLVAAGYVEPFYVAAIGISRCYGGPEEGGWWYDATEILEVRRAWDWHQGVRHARELRSEYPSGKRSRFSVLGGQDVYVETYRTLDALPTEGGYEPYS